MESSLFEIDLLTDLGPGWEHRWLSIPKGLRPKARGCEGRATPGKVNHYNQPQRGCARPPQPCWGCEFSESPTRGRPAARSNPGLWVGIPLGFLGGASDARRYQSTVHGRPRPSSSVTSRPYPFRSYETRLRLCLPNRTNSHPVPPPSSAWSSPQSWRSPAKALNPCRFPSRSNLLALSSPGLRRKRCPTAPNVAPFSNSSAART